MSTISVSIDQIAPGYRCFDAIRDVHGRVLVDRGNRLTSTVIHGLADRGFTIVNVSPRDLAGFSMSHGSQRIKPPLLSNNDFGHEGSSLASRRTRRCCEAYSSERAERFAHNLANTLSLIEEVGSRIARLSKPALAEVCRLPSLLSSMLVEDEDQTLASCTDDTLDDTLARRTTHMSIMAMALGIELGLTDSDVMLLGHAGLLHDLSLFDMPRRYRDPSIPLTKQELLDYQRHPERTVQLLGDHPYVSAETRALIVQAHELGDGTGFPKCVTSKHTHRLSGILNCVEVYLSLTYPGLGRKRIVPHDALGLMLYQARDGVVNPNALRALIHLVTLFPIGSWVELDDQRQAVVIRRYEDQYHAPVVLPQQNAPEDILFLTDSNRTIAAPLASPHEMRLRRQLLPQLCLHDLIDRSRRSPVS